MFKLVDTNKMDTPELQHINYSGLCGALDGQSFKHWLYEEDNKRIFIVKGTIALSYSLLPELERILLSRSNEELNYNVLVQPYAQCMLLYANNNKSDTELLIVVSHDVSDSNPFEDFRKMSNSLLKEMSIKSDCNTDKLIALLSAISYSDTAVFSVEQNLEKSLDDIQEQKFHMTNYTHSQLLTHPAKRLDKDFWYWAFDNAPKALLNEAYDILHENLNTQYERFNQQS